MIEDEEVRSFFEFLISNKAKTKYTTSLSNYVEDARHNTQWRLQYMTWERQRAYDFDEGKEGDAPEKISRCIGLPLEKVLELQSQISKKA